jgi:hypothetical protein
MTHRERETLTAAMRDQRKLQQDPRLFSPAFTAGYHLGLEMAELIIRDIDTQTYTNPKDTRGCQSQ